MCLGCFGCLPNPKSVAEVGAYFDRMLPQLRATEPALDAVKFLRRFGHNVEQKVMVRIPVNGVVGVLPQWGRGAMRIRRSWLVGEFVDKPLTRAAGRLLRWACEPSPIVTTARERMEKGSSPEA